MRGAIFPFHNTPSWRGAQLKHRDNFIFTFTYLNGFDRYDKTQFGHCVKAMG
jgi:hypothetical protein